MRVLTASMAPLMEDDEQDRPDPSKAAETGQQLAGLARAMTKAYMVVGSLIAGLVAGWVIDHYARGGEPLWIAILPIVFMASTLVSLIRGSGKDRP
jgi:F0F1-type ATP synthase assembly protein I